MMPVTFPAADRVRTLLPQLDLEQRGKTARDLDSGTG
jgi:hypothetical protein